MDSTNRLQEAIKQTQLAKRDVEDPDVSQNLEKCLRSLQNGLESLKEDGEI